MKKNRASFFNDQIDYAQINSNVYNQNVTPNPGMQNMPNPNMGMPTFGAQSSFYAGMPNAGVPNNMNMPSNEYDAVESRLAKIERQISRIDHRLTKLENQGNISTNDFDTNINDLYMV